MRNGVPASTVRIEFSVGHAAPGCLPKAFFQAARSALCSKD